MDYAREYRRIMDEQCEIALATCVDNAPNVRIVNFYCDAEKSGVLYFSTFKNNPKTREYRQNCNVAFTTVPTGSNEHVRVRQATVRKSALTIFDLKDAFIRKMPDYAETIEYAGRKLELYEVHFKSASVTLDFMHNGNITL